MKQQQTLTKRLQQQSNAKDAEIAAMKADNAAIKLENAMMKARLNAIEKLLRTHKP